MKHYTHSHLLAHEDGALLAFLLHHSESAEYEASIYNSYLDISFASFQWLNLQRAISLKK